MRTIGILDSEKAAARFGDCLYVRGIENEREREDDGTFSIWIVEEERVRDAAALLAQFRTNPDASEFSSASIEAESRRASELRSERSRRATVADAERINYERSFTPMPIVTYALIVIAAAVAVYSGVGGDWHALRFLSITELYVDGGFIRWIPTLPEVRSGQVWRLVTPIFIHFSLLHIVFNMMLLKDLGTFIEARFSGRYLAILVIATAALSNYAQFVWAGPQFGGMSGVDYALFGFLWMRGKHDRSSSWQLNKNTVYALIGWFVLCLVGIIPNVANMCHGVGLVSGMAWGWISAKRFSR